MQQPVLNDRELVEMYQQGNEDCLTVLIERHQKRIFSAILFLVNNRELAEDIFQDTFVKVINTLKKGSYNEEGKFLPWVLRISHNLVIDHFRRNQRMPMVHDKEDYSIIESLQLMDDNVQDKIVKEQIYKEVRLLVEELPYEQKEVIILRHFADMSFKEIADATGVSINTSLGRMRYALINLRKVIEKKKLVLAA
ncbi:MAG: sigma-70 family RNA polymerase sigma factor [Bacteroidetes bacterium]|jgi:RNA polymerase sigma-70 factor (ECF subfamily)|nr:sigma-70 family RNA polymerase sigma factor [Bacteroidia bacterium]MBS1922442.1 sigma-70 family RNA polymerase sigma factor [Bacteroidota bacterium]MBP7715365.1 sigma-70 family RNA polymerase sigma factor [Bacteroidia bacterium]MBP8669235.1 sigma-70 family RNA polymerase sigma factor [Bacteroidia bacterium]MBX7239357.1 sigma-70 family RNA polymerase sigma factor [Bacteroidia bacterium]